MIIIRFVLAALLVFVVITVAAFRYLEWWQALLVIFASIFAFVIAAKFVVRSFLGNIGKAMMQAFEIKAKVLRGAAAEVHAVEAAPAPPPAVIDQDSGEEEDEDERDREEEADDDEDEEGEAVDRDLAYYNIDVTIRPRQHVDGPMTHWDVGDLCVVDYNAPALRLDMDDQTDAGEGYHFENVRVLEDGRLRADDEQGKYAGEQRMSLLVGVPRALRELKFRYYTEQFGRIVLPPPYPSDESDPRDARPLLA